MSGMDVEWRESCRLGEARTQELALYTEEADVHVLGHIIPCLLVLSFRI